MSNEALWSTVVLNRRPQLFFRRDEMFPKGSQRIWRSPGCGPETCNTSFPAERLSRRTLRAKKSVSSPCHVHMCIAHVGTSVSHSGRS